jgi:hypothetical protein
MIARPVFIAGPVLIAQPVFIARPVSIARPVFIALPVTGGLLSSCLALESVDLGAILIDRRCRIFRTV